MKTFVRNLSLAFCLVLGGLAAWADDAQTVLKQVCHGQFALCTSAPCIPDPSAPGEQAICTCEVAQGANFADKTACPDREPKTVAVVAGLNVQQIISTYAFVQAPTKPVLTCANTHPWTDCLNAKCVIDPRNPLKAICTCPYYDASVNGDVETFVTYGGSCNTNTCASAVWSAATVEAFQTGSEKLLKVMNPRAKDVPWTMCPGHSLDRP